MYDYHSEMHTNEWQRKSGHIKERDNYTCKLCGSSDKFVHVHHRYYIEGRHYWDYDDEALVTLCEDCHEKVHSINAEIAISMINETIVNAHQTGVMYLEIIKAITTLTEKCGSPILNGEKLNLYESRIAGRLKQSVYNDKFKTIDEKKRTFLEELKEYAPKYEPDYIQSFIEYWTNYEKKKFRFENDTKFFMPVSLSNWKVKASEIEREKAYQQVMDAADEYAEEQLKGYIETFEPLIKSAEKEIEENTPQVKASLLEMLHSKAEEMKKMKLKEIIPSFQNPARTVYDYIIRANFPAAFAEIYKKEQGYRCCLSRTNDSFSRGCIIKPSIGKSIAKGIKISNIEAIEEHFNIKLWVPIPFTKHIHFIMESNTYIERQIRKYLLKYPEYQEQYYRMYNGSCKPNIGKDDFQMLYEANQAFKRNNEINLRKFEKLDDISLESFCHKTGIEQQGTDKNVSLKTFLKELNRFSYPENFLSPISVIVYPEHIAIRSPYSQPVLIHILQQMNILYGFTFFIPYSQNIDCKLIIPQEITFQTNGFLFDFCTDSFHNGTMTSVQLPEQLQSVDYYYEKIQSLCEKVNRNK